MEDKIIHIDIADWNIAAPNDDWIAALEAGKVLYFSHLAFTTTARERLFFTPEIRDPKTRNISLDERGRLKGALGDAATQDALALMMARFRQQAHLLIDSLLPRYSGALRLAPTSYRPMDSNCCGPHARAWGKACL